MGVAQMWVGVWVSDGLEVGLVSAGESNLLKNRFRWFERSPPLLLWLFPSQ